MIPPDQRPESSDRDTKRGALHAMAIPWCLLATSSEPVEHGQASLKWTRIKSRGLEGFCPMLYIVRFQSKEMRTVATASQPAKHKAKQQILSGERVRTPEEYVGGIPLSVGMTHIFLDLSNRLGTPCPSQYYWEALSPPGSGTPSRSSWLRLASSLASVYQHDCSLATHCVPP